jgi:hypothetical protein
VIGVALNDEKLVQHRLRWFGHIQRRPQKAPINSSILKSMENTRRGIGQSKLTWTARVGSWTAQKSAIHVPES